MRVGLRLADTNINVFVVEFMSKKIEETNVEIPELLYDGCGNSCSRICPKCEGQSMYINRPGDFRCRNCYKEKWVTVSLDAVLKTAPVKSDKAVDKVQSSKNIVKTKKKDKKKGKTTK